MFSFYESLKSLFADGKFQRPVSRATPESTKTRPADAGRLRRDSHVQRTQKRDAQPV